MRKKFDGYSVFNETFFSGGAGNDPDTQDDVTDGGKTKSGGEGGTDGKLIRNGGDSGDYKALCGGEGVGNERAKFGGEGGGDNKAKTGGGEGGNNKVKIGGGEGGDDGRATPSAKWPYIVNSVDSKTKGYERYADCFTAEFGANANPIKLNMLNRKTHYRI